MRAYRFLALLTGLAVLAPSMANAQAPAGTVRTQGRILEQPAAEAPPTPARREALDNPREDMRNFVQAIKTYARSQNRNFMVVPMNGLALIEKIDPIDPEVRAPARTYLRTIDGVLQAPLFYGAETFGKPTDKKVLEPLLKLTDLAKDYRLKVLVMEYAKTAKTAGAAIRMDLKKGYVPFAAAATGMELNRIPSYPYRPVNENPNSILSLRDVRNFLFLRDSSGFGRQDEFAMKIHGTNFDLIVTDVFHSLAEPLTKQAIETLKYKKLGAKRLVFAYVNIGFAASDRYYWKPGWGEGFPAFIKEPLPTDPDRYFVEFRNPEWQKIIMGDAQSYIYGCIAQGFDGVILDGIDVYKYFEGGLEAYLGIE